MKTKTLFIVALMSLFAFTVSANTDSVVVSYFGSDAENLIETVPTFTIGDGIVVKAKFSNPSTATAVTINVLDDFWGSVPTTDSVYAIPADGNLDVVYNLPAASPLSFFPDSATNKEIRMRVMVTYGDVNVFSFPRFNTYPVNGEYPEIEEPEPDDTPEVADVMQAQLTILSGDSAYAQGAMTGWTTVSPHAKPGDILHFTGTYEPVLGDTAFAQSIETNINYLGSDWGNGPFLHSDVPASVAKGNMDGTIDFKMLVPYFLPDSLLFNNAAFVAASMYPLIQIRVIYSNDPILKDFNGTKGTYNTFYNWWGPCADYEGDMPTTCADVFNISASSASDSSVNLMWDMIRDAVWDVAMAETGTVRNADNAPIKLTTKTLPTVVSGLESGKEYDVFVRSVCDPDSATRTTGDYVQMDGTVTVAGASSLMPVQMSDNVRMYPNPSSGMLTIESLEAYDIIVCDLSGRRVMTTSIATASKDLDLSSISAGIYLIQFHNAQKSFAKTLVKE